MLTPAFNRDRHLLETGVYKRQVFTSNFTYALTHAPFDGPSPKLAACIASLGNGKYEEVNVVKGHYF